MIWQAEINHNLVHRPGKQDYVSQLFINLNTISCRLPLTRLAMENACLFIFSLPCSFVLFVLSRSMGCSMLFFYDVVEKVDANCNVLQITHLAFHQGTSQAMPWLAELVESSEGSLDVLPIQCLCEFLLMGSDENKSNDPKVKQTQVRHKCVYLAVCSITLQGLSTRFI